MAQHLTQQLNINESRLWQSLMEMAQIGGTSKGGCNRQALTELDGKGRDLFVKWAKAIGCEILVDEIGNVFARRAGRSETLPAVITGSHLDTQPTGGKFDGVFGVLAGLEVLRTLTEHNIQTEHPIEVVVWTNEEGARFSPACMGSGVWSGQMALEQVYGIQDTDGISVKQALTAIDYLGSLRAEPRPIKAAFEVHIEQGPILEKQQQQIGVVTGIQGIRWYELEISGTPCHAGPTPMTDRADPIQALLPMLRQCFELAEEFAPWGRATIGEIVTLPGSPNTVPETVKVRVDLRYPDEAILTQMAERFEAAVERSAKLHATPTQINRTWQADVTQFDTECIAAVQLAADELGYSNMRMVSGAGHDSLYVSQCVPTSMIFVPCERGLSHNEAENANSDDLAAGANVLLHSLLRMAGRAE